MGKTELAISTEFAGVHMELEHTEELFRRIAGAGFTHVHWCHEWDGDYTYSVYEMQQAREWMEKYGLRAKALHASRGSSKDIRLYREHYRKDYTSDWEYNRRAGVELIQNRVDFAHILGASEIVLHLYVPHITLREEPEKKEIFYGNVYKSLDELMPYCLEKGVRICVDDLYDITEECMLEAWERLLGKYPPEFLGICYDTGHANMLWRDRAPQVVDKYKDRMYAVHLHDNFGATDAHLIPWEAQIDWEQVIKVIGKSAYEGPLILEVGCHDKDMDVFLGRAYEAGCRLDEMLRKVREA